MKINLNKIKNFNITSLLVLSTVTILFFVIYFLVFVFDFQKDWSNYQKDYRDLAIQMAKTDDEKVLINDFKIEIKQAVVEPLNRVDRCISCHVAIDHKGFENVPQPLRSHPGFYIDNHPVEDFGCTVCHNGLGKATTKEAAHGEGEEGKLYPMYRGVFVQSSCGKCHDENSYVETSVIGTGKRLYEFYGCNICHKLYKSGGTAGPDLTKIGSKKYYDVDWGENYKGEKNLTEWLINHFKDPSHYYESKMMDFKMNDENARALAVYMLSLVEEQIPGKYLVNKNKVSK